MTSTRSSPWIALMIGNSRLHWAIFIESTLHYAWDTPHWSVEAIAQLTHAPLVLDTVAALSGVDLPSHLFVEPMPVLWLASVVPAQTTLWQSYPRCRVLTLEQVPLQGLYPTLGIDRALALWGAIDQWGAPILVIDAGTALTLTGANEHQSLVGGAILPGLQLQMRSLFQHTAALPAIDTQFTSLPPRWADNTPDAIRSGVLYGVLASVREFVQSWLQQFPTSAIALTGGDHELLYQALQILHPHLSMSFNCDSTLVLRGIAAVFSANYQTDPGQSDRS